MRTALWLCGVSLVASGASAQISEAPPAQEAAEAAAPAAPANEEQQAQPAEAVAAPEPEPIASAEPAPVGEDEPAAPPASSPREDAASAGVQEAAPAPQGSKAEAPPVQNPGKGTKIEPVAQARLVNKPAPKPEPAIEYSQLPMTYHQQRIDLSAGVRFHWVPDSDYEMLADSSPLPLFNLRAAGTVWTQEKASLAISGEWDFGKSGGSARNVPTSMTLNRFQLGAEGRYHFLHRLAAYGRVSGGLALLGSRLGDPGDFTEMTTSQALFTGALTAGAAFRFAGSRDGRERALRAHVFVEAGYSYLSRANLEYEMNDDGPLRPEPVDLGDLSLSGAELSTGLIVSF